MGQISRSLQMRYLEAIDILVKDGKSSRVAARLAKTLWTSAVEGALEYQRVIADLFPDGSRNLRFVVSDFVGRFLTPAWLSKLQTADNVLKALSNYGAPDEEADPDSCCIINGVSLAVEALSEASEKQKSHRKRDMACENFGRIVIFTQLKQDEEVSMIEQHVLEQIAGRNKLVQNLDENYLAIKQVHLCIVNVIPRGKESKSNVSDKPVTEICAELVSEVRCTFAGSHLIACIHGLLQQHFGLVSTTISGIPMKEEANQGQSMNYDVELLHGKESHNELNRLGLLNEETGLFVPSQNAVYHTLRLSWCTPNAKIPIDQFPNVTCATRVTAASVNGRPSACLTTFLLSGKNVLLEMSRKAGGTSNAISPNVNGRLISHLLMCHDGVIYIHSMALGPGCLDEAPSISDGPGGRITDYRITHFAELMRECRCSPVAAQDDTAQVDTFNANARTHIRRLTGHWPLTFSASLVFSIAQKFEPILSRIKKTELSSNDVDACMAHIYSLMTMEQQREPLLAPSMQCAKLRGIKNRDDQYRMAFEELASYLRNYAHVSDKHKGLLDSFVSCVRLPKISPLDIDLTPQSSATVQSVQMSQIENVAEKESDRKGSADNGRSPVAKKRKTNVIPWQPDEKINFYEFLYDKYVNERWSKWRDFEGRKASSGPLAPLYADLERKSKIAKSGVMAANG